MRIIKKIKKNKGFVILFAVTLAAILLSIALGVSEVAIKENSFSTSAEDTDNAFFAADTGTECALYYDSGDSTQNAFTGSASMDCANNSNVNISESSPTWTFSLFDLGGASKGCVNVTMDKTDPNLTTVTALGYNSETNSSGTCVPAANAVERELITTY